MIDDEQYSKFKFNGDDEPESEQTLYQDEAKDRRVEKLSHRVTIISILIPVLIGVVFYIAYRDITSRVSQSQDTEAMEIQNLSTQLQDKFDELSTNYGQLEASLVQKLAALEKVDKAMKANLKKAENTVSKINATKADKKDQQDAIAKIDTALSPIRMELKDLSTMRNDLKAVTAELQSLDTDVQQKLTTISANVDKSLQNLTKIQSDMSALSNQKLDKDALQLELLKAKKSYQRELELTKAALDKRLSSILRKIRDLEKIAQAPLAVPKPSGRTSSRGSANIVEQEIKE
jgi:DNA repair exonuclease SbcCD ATPase subunit